MVMEFENNENIRKMGVVFGYSLSYVLFTTILYFILNFLGKIPMGVSYLHIYILTTYIAIIGFLIKRVTG